MITTTGGHGDYKDSSYELVSKKKDWFGAFCDGETKCLQQVRLLEKEQN